MLAEALLETTNLEVPSDLSEDFDDTLLDMFEEIIDYFIFKKDEEAVTKMVESIKEVFGDFVDDSCLIK